MPSNGHLTLTEAATLLGMKPPNTAAFLERHGVEPVDERPWRRRWAHKDVMRARREYERSGRREGDRKRREAANRNLRARQSSAS